MLEEGLEFERLGQLRPRGKFWVIDLLPVGCERQTVLVHWLVLFWWYFSVHNNWYSLTIRDSMYSVLTPDTEKSVLIFIFPSY